MISGYKKYLIRSGMIVFWLFVGALCMTFPRLLLYREPRHIVTILTMPNTLNSDMFAEFTRQTGIAVSLSYAENADEVGMKIRATQGRGYDLIMVADYQISELIRSTIIQPLDHTKIEFLSDLQPALCNHAFDPGNQYSIPYYWGVYGFGIDKDFFENTREFSWQDLFDNTMHTYNVGMRDDIRELILIAAYYLFGTIYDLHDEQYEAIKQLLITQKQKVIMYADERIDTLLISHTTPLILTISGDLSRAIDAYNYIDFVMPVEGSFVDIDSFVIPASATYTDKIYRFLNYLYSKPVLSYYAHLFKLSPALSTIDTYAKIPLLAHPTKELFSHLQFFATVIPQYHIDAILVALKSA